MKRYFLVDCNNFFVSCERVFNPYLHNKPVAVLSSNDACVIARSNELKALGVAMGAPAFTCQALFKKHNVAVLSANFALYGDMSARVMQTLTHLATDIEFYSIDEAFLFVPAQENAIAYYTYGHRIKKQVKQHTGIPVSIGIGPTKTLAKIANHIAKKNARYQGVFDITDYAEVDEILATISVEDIWGIGYRYAKKLKSKGIVTARDFKQSDESWVRKHMTVMGLKTLLELRGISCLQLDDIAYEKQSITVARSFGRLVIERRELEEAVASYMTTAAHKMRAQHMVVQRIAVFVVSVSYHEEYMRNYHTMQYILPVATAYTPTLITAAKYCVQSLYRQGLRYKKAGVILMKFASSTQVQMNMYASIHNTNKQKELMHIVDHINTKWGNHTLTFASQGTKQPWKMKQAKKSPRFTTSWHELLKLTI